MGVALVVLELLVGAMRTGSRYLLAGEVDELELLVGAMRTTPYSSRGPTARRWNSS